MSSSKQSTEHNIESCKIHNKESSKQLQKMHSILKRFCTQNKLMPTYPKVPGQDLARSAKKD